jgi:Fe-S-cluster containining protein
MFQPNTESTKEWLNVRGLGYTYNEEFDSLIVLVSHTCPNFIDNKCLIHGENKPESCKIFPQVPFHLTGLNNCGYKFVED